MVMVLTQLRCGYRVTGAAGCPISQTMDGGRIHRHLSPHAAGTREGPWSKLEGLAATPSMESGSNPTLCLRSGTTMYPGRVLPGYSSWLALLTGGIQINGGIPGGSKFFFSYGTRKGQKQLLVQRYGGHLVWFGLWRPLEAEKASKRV